MAQNEISRRGVWERVPGYGNWWIRYRVGGQLRREKVGRKSDAIRHYDIRRAAITMGKNFPVNMRSQRKTVAEIGQQAIDWYENHGPKDLKTITGLLSVCLFPKTLMIVFIAWSVA